MNQLTQQNAANLEESAGAAKELSAQAGTMRKLVTAFQLAESSRQNFQDFRNADSGDSDLGFESEKDASTESEKHEEEFSLT